MVPHQVVFLQAFRLLCNNPNKLYNDVNKKQVFMRISTEEEEHSKEDETPNKTVSCHRRNVSSKSILYDIHLKLILNAF